MTQTSIGFDGTVDTVQWAGLSRYLGRDYCVGSDSALAVTQSPGARTAIVAAGLAFGRGVATTLDAAENIPIPVPAAGQWYLVVLRRVWATKATSLVPIPHTTTTTATPSTYPTSYPAARLVSPGVQDEQPVAWVWVNASNTTMVIVDLRISAAATERLTVAAASKVALDKIVHLPVGALGLVGSAQYSWSGATWVAQVVDSGWVAVALLNGWTTYSATYGPLEYRITKDRIQFRGVIKPGTTASGTAIFTIGALSGLLGAKTRKLMVNAVNAVATLEVTTAGEFALSGTTSSIFVSFDGAGMGLE